MATEPPKFKPFTKMRVVLSLEPTPTPQQQATDLLAAVPAPFGGPGAAGGAGAAATVQPMFAKKPRAEKPPRAKKLDKAGTLFPGLLEKARTVLGAPGGGAPEVYARMNVLSRDAQAIEIGKLPEELQAIAKGVVDIETKIPYEIEPPPPVFIPSSRRGFGSFLINQYGPIFPKGSQKALDVATCAAKGEEGKKEVKIYHYQAFIREYLRYETPYRGLLVYHGLGSGKTCSAIAAAEALFGTRGVKVIVMTPYSLRDNFISEISFCGFKHFRLQNRWIPLSLAPGSSPDPEMVKMFAENVYGIPRDYFGAARFFNKFGRGMAKGAVGRVWIPDFSEGAEPNFDSLTAQERNEINLQIRATIENRIKFINYNGISARELKTMVCSTPDIFDNAVIVIDEVHNVTRLIQGTIESYFSNPSGRRRTTPLEKLTPDRQKLPLCGMTKAYLRGYLFYRLLMDAKNTKIIGLSGTPLINFPEELGILMNILHGPMNTIEFVVRAEGMRDVQPIVEKAVKQNPDLDTVFFKAAEGTYAVTALRLPEQFTKVLDDEDNFLGIRRREPGVAIPTLQEVWETLAKELKSENIQVAGAPTLKASELLPSWDTPFRGAFLQEDGITLKNELVLQKRIRGLVSYYRGIQGSVMPRVIKDEIVGVPLTGYSLKVYNKLRNEEIKTEMKKPKQGATKSDEVWAEANEIATMKSPSNYRMSSRQACNFVFPDGVVRPRPRDVDEQDAETGRDRDQVIDKDIEEEAAGRDEADVENEARAEAEDAVVQAELAANTGDAAEVAGKVAAAGAGMNARDRARAYIAAIKTSKDKLRAIGKTHLRLDGPPEHNLARYSPKFAAMMTNIMKLPGSSLVYSQFLEMEGIGIFGICMEANDFVPIEILESHDGALKFSDRTAASLAKGPGVKENRYIEFTGTGSKNQRAAAVNVFNARIDKLSPSMAKIMTDAGWKNNNDGGLCRCFCITSAGAEGLSLKCVRGVHIMEPYWNTVRTQQVKGRAVRICSHMELPEDQQNVEIYTYCTIIPEEAIAAQAIDKTLERSDVYNAKEAADLGVPVPAPAGDAVPEGLFYRVEADEKSNAEANAGGGADATMFGAVRFYSKLDNEFRGFSNFAPTPFVVDSKRYPTVEHYFQAMKFPSDPMWAEAIRVAPTPAKAKLLGQSREHPMRPDWDKVKETVMLEALREKFKQNPPVLETLKGTGSRPIVEASPDPYWGEGRTGKGKNRLGKLIEQIREELRDFIPPAAAAAGGAGGAAVDDTAVTEDFFGGEEVVEGGEAVEAAAEDLEALVAGGGGAGAPKTVQSGGGEMSNAIMPLQTGGGEGDDRTIILTSDQRVLLISLRKERVIGSLQNLMKSVAVDCEMNFADNNDGSFRCLNLGESVGDFAFHPNLADDIAESESRFRLKEKAVEAPAAPAVTLAPAAGAPPPALTVAEEAAGGGAAAALPAAVVPAPAEPPKPKPKRMIYKGKEYFYQIKMNDTGAPLGYIVFDSTDKELTRPVGFITADPATKMPKGPVGPVPE